MSWSGASPWQTINTVGWAITDLAVGDFDGDQAADLFLATGNEWFWAPGGRSWAVLAPLGGRTTDLLFGDLTGDRKTDVFGVVGNQWEIVAGGTTRWQSLGPALTSTTAGLVVADFDGDGFADVARTVPGALFTSAQWQYAARGAGGFVTLRAGDPQNVASLPVGRFDGDAKADLLEWSSGRFAISSGATGSVTTLSRQAMR